VGTLVTDGEWFAQHRQRLLVAGQHLRPAGVHP
jgi:hypothetical protein